MRGALVALGFVLVMGTGIAIRIGVHMKQTKDRAMAASANLKMDVENARARNKLRRDWANEHEVISDIRFVGFTHGTQTIGGVEVHCPKCKEL